MNGNEDDVKIDLANFLRELAEKIENNGIVVEEFYLKNIVENNSKKKCEWCGEYYNVGEEGKGRQSKYCGNCAKTATIRQKINRERKNILKGEKTVKEVALEYGKTENEIKEWINEYEPKNTENKKLLKTFKANNDF